MYKNIPCHCNVWIIGAEVLMLLIFNLISTYTVTQVFKTVEDLKYELIGTQKIIINFLDFNRGQYRKSNLGSKK